ncbi:MAG: 4-(cytidine 5'-diphospho)-2-C-methyl-D-erythritol kinase [Acidobacteria bacterium]|nr:4-(cytidine 5'-diphospho)-2-C-methyl-D-erythritol kinase [Acidobacteriota bacterium]
MKSLLLRPHAKINLGLRVLGKRADGYHELRTRFQSIDLTDELEIQPAERGLHLEVEGAALPADDSNLVLKAARMLGAGRPELPGARIRLKKKIPLAAGLGGGSSDAAATLLGLNHFWGLRLPKGELHRMASSLGADIGFFLVGGAALGVGRGDEILPLPDCAPFRIALLLPPFASSTAEVYRRWDEDSLGKRPPGGEPSAWRPEADPQGEPSSLSVHNDLERLVVTRHAQLSLLKDALIQHGAVAAALSGSGPSLYGLFPSGENLADLQNAREWEGVRLLDCVPVGRAAYWQRLGLPPI